MRGWGLLVLALLSACEKELELPQAIGGRGTITVIDTGGATGRTGWWPSVAFSSDDEPHLSYCDAHRGNLMYAARKDGQWQTEVVEHRGAVGKYTALAVDSKGEPAIAFYDQGHKYLRYAWREDGEWKTERIAWGLEIGMGSELVFDERDIAHLFYYVPSGRLIHNQRTGPGSWQAQTVDDAVGGFSAKISVIPRKDGFWVTYVNWGFKDTALMLARPKPEGGYAVETIAEKRGPGWRSVLYFEDESPRVVYSQSLKERIKLAQHKQNGWEPVTLLRRAANFAGTQAPNGDLILAYEDIFWGHAGNGTVKYLRLSGGSWKRVVVDDEGPAGEYIDVATDSKGKPLIAYYSEAIRGLKVYDETDGATKARAAPKPSDTDEPKAKDEPGATDENEAPTLER